MSFRRRAVASALTVALSVAGLVAVPGTASATHPANSCLDVEPETASNPIGTQHDITATLRTLVQTDCTGAVMAAGSNIDVLFEITGPNDPDAANTPGTPDLTCRLHPNDTSCTVSFSGSTAGTDTILGWIDHDNDGVVDAATVDPQDSVSKTWTTVVAGIALDCDDASGNDDEINPAGQGETYTCTLTQPDGADQDTARDPVANTPIDFENLNGANDPDNSVAAGTADGNNACTTNNTGTCQIVINPSEGEAGTANICFWADTDGDNVFAPTGGGNDGGGCTTEAASTEDLNLIDVVTKTWTTGPVLDCDDASGDDDETNPVGSSEVYTCTLTTDDSADADTARDPIANAAIDWENLNGANDPDNSQGAGAPDANNACVTGAAGTCTVTITATESQTGGSSICFWYDQDNDNVFDPAGNGAPADGGGCATETPVTEDQDLIDVVIKNWVVSYTLDCDDESGDDQQVNQAGQSELYTCTVTQPDGTDADALPDLANNIAVDAENMNGPNDPDNSAAAGTADFNACTTSNAGTCTFTLPASENESGTANVCFWVDADTDTAFAPAGSEFDGGGCATETSATEDTNVIDVVTKSWAFPDGRSILCGNDVQALTGQTVTFSCVVTDRFNVPVAGESVTFATSGVGALATSAVVATDSSGLAGVQVTSAEGGTQTITATITDDLTGAEPAEVDECDRAAGDPAASMVGSCADSMVVTWVKAPAACLAAGAIIGTDASETLTGTEGADVICALGGDDTIITLGGNDQVFAGAGNDLVRRGDGADQISGGAGDDVLAGGAGNDEIKGGAGADFLGGGSGNDLLRGGSGSDTLRGGEGRDTCTDGARQNDVKGCE